MFIVGAASQNIGPPVSLSISPPVPVSFSGPLSDWLGQIMLYSHWSTQTWRSTNTCVPATDEAVVCTLIEPSNAGAY